MPSFSALSLVLSLVLLAGTPAIAQTPQPCLAVSEELVSCDPVTRPGELDYSCQIHNRSEQPLRAIQLAATTGADRISSSLIEFETPLEPDASITIGPVKVFGAVAGTPVRFCILAVGTDPGFCCLQNHHLVPGDCGPSVAPLLAPNGFKTRPCDEPAPPETCLQICDDYVSCDNRGCYYYSFTVTNRSGSVVDHVFVPDSRVTPDALRFPAPLSPGEAARVWVEICGVPPGPFTLPVVLGSCRDSLCCGVQHQVELPQCPCISLVDETSVWTTGGDGSTRIDYAATVQNYAPWEAGTIMLAALAPTGTSLETTRFPLGKQPPTRSRPVSTRIDLPAGAGDAAEILIIMHSIDFEECCLLEQTIHRGGTVGVGDPAPPIVIEKRPNGVALRFRAPEGKLCCAQRSTDLGDWETIQAIDGVGQEVQVEVGPHTGRPQRFFRLQIGNHQAP